MPDAHSATVLTIRTSHLGGSQGSGFEPGLSPTRIRRPLNPQLAPTLSRRFSRRFPRRVPPRFLRWSPLRFQVLRRFPSPLQFLRVQRARRVPRARPFKFPKPHSTPPEPAAGGLNRSRDVPSLRALDWRARRGPAAAPAGATPHGAATAEQPPERAAGRGRRRIPATPLQVRPGVSALRAGGLFVAVCARLSAEAYGRRASAAARHAGRMRMRLQRPAISAGRAGGPRWAGRSAGRADGPTRCVRRPGSRTNAAGTHHDSDSWAARLAEHCKYPQGRPGRVTEVDHRGPPGPCADATRNPGSRRDGRSRRDGLGRVGGVGPQTAGVSRGPGRVRARLGWRFARPAVRASGTVTHHVTHHVPVRITCATTCPPPGPTLFTRSG